MIVPIDSNLQAVVRFRHRYFLRLHVPRHRMRKIADRLEQEPVSDSFWVELSGAADDCRAIATGVDTMSRHTSLVHGFKPFYVTRGTVCTLKFLIRSNEPGAMWYTQPGNGSSAFVVCAWDPEKGRHEPFIKWKGRRESLAKAIESLGSYHEETRGKLLKAGLLDMVCPEPPPKPKRQAPGPHVEIAGDMRVTL